MTDRRVIDVVADLLGDSVILRLSHLFANPRRRQARQLAPYWPLAPSRVVTAWLAIEDVDKRRHTSQPRQGRIPQPLTPAAGAGRELEAATAVPRSLRAPVFT